MRPIPSDNNDTSNVTAGVGSNQLPLYIGKDFGIFVS